MRGLKGHKGDKVRERRLLAKKVFFLNMSKEETLNFRENVVLI